MSYQPPDIQSFTSFEPKDSDTKGSRLLYGSKVTDYQLCPRMAFFKHHLAVYPKERPRYFIVGSALHKAAEIGLLKGFEFGLMLTLPDSTGGLQVLRDELTSFNLEDLNNLTPDERNLVNQMYEAFFEEWNKKPRTLLEVERTVKMPITSSMFDFWTAKADQVLTDDTGTWNGDIKTTSGYGPSVARQYHDSLQTKTYGFIMRTVYPDIRGAKIFVCTKKAVRCVEETIPFDSGDYYQGELHITSATYNITKMEEERYFPRNCSACINSYGHKCPYFSLCMEKPATNPNYVKEIINDWFEVRNPDEHLELD